MKTGFIFSLPRAGSTYVQRVLSGSDAVATTSEPWLLPALMGIRYGRQPYAEWGYDHARIGLDDILGNLEHPEEAWQDAMRAACETLFSHFARPDQIFIDKTPRSAEFASKIVNTFPNGRFLFLWRNPLSVVKSINSTWGNGHWKAYFYEYDLVKGLSALIETYSDFKDDPRIMAIRYEDLVAKPEIHWPRVFEHFGVDYEVGLVARPPKLVSRMGDITGQEKFTGTSSSSIDDWPTSFGSSIRRRWARRYLEGLGEESLNRMGYNMSELLDRLQRAPRKWDPTDYFYITLSAVYHRVHPHVWRNGCHGAGKTYAVR